MPRYVIEREVRLSPEEMKAAGERYVAMVDSTPGVQWIRSYISEQEGKIYCEFEAPNIEMVKACQAKAQLPFTRISLVSAEVNPSMFK